MASDDAVRVSTPRTPSFTLVFAALGAASMSFTNALRARPALYQPWMHVALALVGGYAGNRLAHVYDDTTAAVNRQMTSYALLPSWAHGELTAEDLSAELREKRLAQLRSSARALAAIEEAEYKGRLAAMGEEELRSLRAEGAVRIQ